MSIELPLIRALVILPHYFSERNPQSQRWVQVRLQGQNAGSAKPNHKICWSVFPSKIELTNFWEWLKGSSNLHKQFRFKFQRSVVKTASAAARYSVSDESSECDGAVKEAMLKLSMKLPEECELELTDGPEIADGYLRFLKSMLLIFPCWLGCWLFPLAFRKQFGLLVSVILHKLFLGIQL